MTDLAPVASGIAVDRIAGLERAMERMDVLIAKCLRRAIRAGTKSLGEVVTAAAERATSAVSFDDLARIDQSWRNSLAEEILPALGKSYEDGAFYTMTELQQLGAQAGALVDYSSPAARAFIAGSTDDLSNVGTQTWQKLRYSLANGLQDGESIEELADRVRAQVASSEIEARRIARTNVISASSAGSLAQAKALGGDDPPPRKVWLATSDARTRESHWQANGQERALDDPFLVGGAHLQFPGDPAGPAREVQNCRCTLTWVVGETPAAVQQEADPRVVDEEPTTMVADQYVLADRNAEAFAKSEHFPVFADQRGLRPAEYRAEADRHVARILNSKKVTTNQPYHVGTKILKGDRFKNQFETQTSGGYIDSGNTARRKLEREVFGIRSKDPRDHPIYGSLSDVAPNGEVGFESTDAYGAVKFVLKDEVRSRTTWTTVDSLGDGDKMSVGNLGRPSLDGWHTSLRYDPLEWDGTPRGIGSCYLEVQIHGNTDVNDVEAVFVNMLDVNIARAFAGEINASPTSVIGQQIKEEIEFLTVLDRSGIPWYMKSMGPGNVERWVRGVLP